MKNRIAAALLALFLGYIGIHKFYLGQNCAGIAYFLFSWTLIPGIMAFFEFLNLALMSDEAFDMQYNKTSYSQMISGSYQDKVNAIGDLKKLYDAGAITAEEYESKRRKLLDSL